MYRACAVGTDSTFADGFEPTAIPYFLQKHGIKNNLKFIIYVQ